MRKTLRRLLLGATTILLALGLSGCNPKAGSEVTSGPSGLNEDWVRPEDLFQEGEDAFAAVYNMRSGVNLGNGFDSTSFNETSFAKGEEGWILKYTDKTPSAWEKAWGQPVTTKKLIKGIKALGFNAVRVPVTWAEHIDFETGEINSAWLNRVQEVVDWIIDEDMYCLLNTHHDGGTDGWVEASDALYEKYSGVYKELYTNIGNKFKDYSDRLILCGTNEMISADDNWGDAFAEAIRVVNQWNQLFVDTIRATGDKNATRNLMVGTYCCSTNEGNLKGFVKPEDPAGDKKLIMEVHIYTPKGFVWSKESWISNWTTKWNSNFESEVKTEFSRVDKYAKKYDMPVIIGEWGTLSRRFPGNNGWEATTDAEGAKFTSCFIKESRDRGFTSFYWDTQEILDRATGTVTSPLMINGIRENY
ncbi:MAG: glycoside hydrolase family 5 protein [Treponema sp.]|nr:glycoside hydrolase family 5 protein [Treponema sp.]